MQNTLQNLLVKKSGASNGIISNSNLILHFMFFQQHAKFFVQIFCIKNFILQKNSPSKVIYFLV